MAFRTIHPVKKTILTIREEVVGNRLFHLHKEIALENGCKQMFLEVIVGNDRAIRFYNKRGYEKVYDIVYYSHNNPSELNAALPNELEIKRIDMDLLSTLSGEIQDIHINWQNDFDYISRMDSNVHYGIFNDTKLIGGLSIHPLGKLNFLWINSEFRHRGMGRGLIMHAVKELNIDKLVMNFPNNADLLGFVKHLNFTKDSISQYEMYLTV